MGGAAFGVMIGSAGVNPGTATVATMVGAGGGAYFGNLVGGWVVKGLEPEIDKVGYVMDQGVKVVRGDFTGGVRGFSDMTEGTTGVLGRMFGW